METSASLLERLRTSPDEASWRRLDDLYRPLISRWLLRDPSLRHDADDIVQEVMVALVRELPGFQRRRNGSFRRWLRTITATAWPPSTAPARTGPWRWAAPWRNPRWRSWPTPPAS